MASTFRGPVLSDPSTITVDRIRSNRFTTTFRGYDVAEVKSHLDAVAEAYQNLLTTESDLREQIRVASLRTGTPGDSRPSGAGAVTVVSTGLRILDAVPALRVEPFAADSVAATPGEESAARDDNFGGGRGRGAGDVVGEAHIEAEAFLAAARNEANAIVAKANDEAARIILRARAESRGRPSGEGYVTVGAAMADLPDDPDLAREQVRLMVTEAKAVREKILTDLAKRRRVAHVQLEQMRVAKEKLVESLRETRRMVDEASRDLSTAEVEARIAADAAGRKVSSEPLPTAAELEVELLSSRYLVNEAVASVAQAPVVEESEAIDLSHSPSEAEVDSVVDLDAVGESISVAVVADVVEVEVEAIEVVVDDVAGVDVAEADVVEADVVEADVVEAVAVEADVVEAVAVEVVETGAIEVVSAEVDAVVDVGADRASSIERLEAPGQAETVQTLRPSAKRASKTKVDDLFARLRVEREMAADAARVLLTGTEVSERAEASPSLPEAALTRPHDELPEGEVVVVIDLTAVESEVVPVNRPNTSAPGLGDDLANEDDLLTSELANSGGYDAGRTAANSLLHGQDHEQLAYVLGPVRDHLVRSVKRVLQDEQSVALSALRTSRSRLDLNQLLGTESEHPARLRAVVEPALVRAFAAGLDQRGALMVVNSDATESHTNTLAAEAVDASASAVCVAIVSSLRAQLGVELERVSDPQTDASSLIDSVASCYRSWSSDRLHELVEPALRESLHAGSVAAVVR